MKIRQSIELRKLLAPVLRQSLQVLTLPLLDLKTYIENELEENPFLEEIFDASENAKYKKSPSGKNVNLDLTDEDSSSSFGSKKMSLQDILLRQLGMFAQTDEQLTLGQEIIGNIDENGYLKVPLAEIATTLKVSLETAENTLKLIQKFEPIGVAARSISECLLIQLEAANNNDPLLKKLVEFNLDDIAKKNYSLISKKLKEPLEKIEPLIKKILSLNPKPGRNYSTDQIQRIVPDAIIEQKDEDGEDLEITINNEDFPTFTISKEYTDMLKNDKIDPQTKEFLKEKFKSASELLKAIAKRHGTLRKVIELVINIQREAITECDLSLVKPLTFQQVAKDLEMHESTICRVVMNKYIKTPCGTVALKDFFTSYVKDTNGQTISSNYIRRLIKEYIDNEDKKCPLSDDSIAKLISENNNLKVARRTVAKYREELKILSTTFRKER